LFAMLKVVVVDGQLEQGESKVDTSAMLAPMLTLVVRLAYRVAHRWRNAWQVGREWGAQRDVSTVVSAAGVAEELDAAASALAERCWAVWGKEHGKAFEIDLALKEWVGE